jgi:hypothetical protein
LGSGFPGVRKGRRGFRSEHRGMPSGHLGELGLLQLLLPLPKPDDQGQREGQDDHEEHQGTDAESPAGTVVLHDPDLDTG